MSRIDCGVSLKTSNVSSAPFCRRTRRVRVATQFDFHKKRTEGEFDTVARGECSTLVVLISDGSVAHETEIDARSLFEAAALGDSPRPGDFPRSYYFYARFSFRQSTAHRFSPTRFRRRALDGRHPTFTLQTRGTARYGNRLPGAGSRCGCAGRSTYREIVYLTLRSTTPAGSAAAIFNS